MAMDYPDWQRYSQWVGPTLIDEDIAVGVAPPVVRPLGAVPNFRALELTSYCLAQDHQIRLRYHVGPGTKDLVDETIFFVSAGQMLDVIVPIRGESVDLWVRAAAVDTVSVLVKGTNRNPRLPVSSRQGLLLWAYNQAVAAGASDTQRAVNLYHGLASAHIKYSGVNFTWTLEALNDQGAAVAELLEAIQTGGIRQDFQFTCPPYIIQSTFHNQDGAPHAYWLSIVGEPT